MGFSLALLALSGSVHGGRYPGNENKLTDLFVKNLYLRSTNG